MPCYIYLRGDADPIHCNDPADLILQRVEEAQADAFIHITLTPYAHDDAVRTAYVIASAVVAILPMHLRELEAELDDPPDWYSR